MATKTLGYYFENGKTIKCKGITDALQAEKYRKEFDEKIIDAKDTYSKMGKNKVMIYSEDKQVIRDLKIQLGID